MIMGMPLYGRGFLLDNLSKNGLYASASNPIPAGPYTGTDGFWGYNEVRYTLIYYWNIQMMTNRVYCCRCASSSIKAGGPLLSINFTRFHALTKATTG